MSVFNPNQVVQELRRRRVFNTVALYIVGAWVALQVAELALPALEIPEVAIRYVWIGTFALFPLVLIFGWRYDITRGGIRHTPPAGVTGEFPLTSADRWIIGAFSGIALAVVAAMLLQIRQLEPPRVQVAPENSIAVLPFEVCVAQQRDQPLAYQLATEVINRLASRGTIKVIARTTAYNLAGFGWSKPRIARELNVSYVLSGELCREGELLTITAELSDSDGFILKREHYQQVINPYNQIEKRLATQVANNVAAELGDFAQPAPDAPVDRRAHEQLLIGREYLVHEQWEKAGEAFDKALEIQPDFAEALFEKAMVEIKNRRAGSSVERARKALDISEEALALAMQQTEHGIGNFKTHMFIGEMRLTMSLLEEGLLYRQAAGFDELEIAGRKARRLQYLEDAEQSFRTAAVLNPSETAIYGRLAFILDDIGGERRAEALEFLEMGQERDPFNVKYNQELAFRLAEWGYFHQAMELLDRFKMLPDGMGWLWWAQLEITNNHMRFDDQFATLVEIIQTDPDAFDNTYILGQLWRFTPRIVDLGMLDEAEMLYRLVAQIPFASEDPFDTWAYQIFLVDYFVEQVGDEDEVIARRGATAAAMSNEEILDGAVWVANLLAGDLWRAGFHERAVEILEGLRHPEILKKFAERQMGPAMDIAQANIELGRADEAVPLLEDAVSHLEEEVAIGIRHPETLRRLAEVYALLGRDDDALDMLEVSVDYGNWESHIGARNWMRFSKLPFDHLHEDPRFLVQNDRMIAIRDHQAANIRRLLARQDMETLLQPVVELWAEKVAALKLAIETD